jgi:Ca2+-transporting ATPase
LIAGALVLALANAAEPESDLLSRGRKAFWVIGAMAVLVMAVVLYLPAAARLFRLAPPAPELLGVTLLLMLPAAGWSRLRSRR